MTERILITGATGFIGFHAARKLLSLGYHVIGVDNLNDYYEPRLKQARLSLLNSREGFDFFRLNIEDESALERALGDFNFDYILHLAAQAGVRYSLENPRAFINSNIVGHFNVLEFAARCTTLKHLVYASSSSIYGDRNMVPFEETDHSDHPASLYAATKLSGEVMSQAYTNLHGIAQTGLRFFTVYGPWGRPDMAYFLFTDAIRNGRPIELFAPDEMERDFTYVDDIIDVLPKIIRTPPASGHAIFNLGSGKPSSLRNFLKELEGVCGDVADIKIRPKQNGDVNRTFANIRAASTEFDFAPKTTLQDGLSHFVKWYDTHWEKICSS